MLKAEAAAKVGHFLHVILTQKRIPTEACVSAVDRHRDTWKGMTRNCRVYRKVAGLGVSLVRSLHVEAAPDPTVTSWHVHTHVILHAEGLEDLHEGAKLLVESWLKHSPGAVAEHQRTKPVKSAEHLQALCAYLPEEWSFPSPSREVEAHQALNGVRMWAATGTFRGWRQRSKKRYETVEVGQAAHRASKDHPALLGFKDAGNKLLKPRELDADGNPVGDAPTHTNADGEVYDPSTGEVVAPNVDAPVLEGAPLIPVSLPRLSPPSTLVYVPVDYTRCAFAQVCIWPPSRGPPQISGV